MSWFRTHAGGRNNPVEINVDAVDFAEHQTVNGRQDVVLHLRSGEEIRIDPVQWELARGDLLPLPERTE